MPADFTLNKTEKKRLSFLLIWMVFSLLFWNLTTGKLFPDTYSGVLLDRNGKLLQARIASDGQWRFPPGKKVPEGFKTALLHFEDKRFYYHPGIDPLRVAKAVLQRIQGKPTKSGASTLSMQLVRISRRQNRTLYQKIMESVLALRLELVWGKEKILDTWCRQAPFGGNVVGIDAAAWRYFGKDASLLSQAQCCALAVLPNSPSLVRPGKNTRLFLKKRNQLLYKLKQKGLLSESDYQLACLEPLPAEPHPLPENAPHLLTSLLEGKIPAEKDAVKGFFQTSLDATLQERCLQKLAIHYPQWEANGILNGALLVLDIEKNEVLAYVGNVYQPHKSEADSYVDMIPSMRSPGSTLKPVLYAAMQEDGLLLPHSLVADIPTEISGYQPKNFDLSHSGAVAADEALARSLNIPAVRMLQQYRYERLHSLLKDLGLKGLSKPADHYGLSLILGGGENSMWQLAGMYASLARRLNHFTRNSSRYFEKDIAAPAVSLQGTRNLGEPLKEVNGLGAGSIYLMVDAMKELMRPGDELLWQRFSSSRKIAWKTGTSFGNRDAWAIGFDSKYLVAVWAGNADGEGKSALIGLQIAAPLLFDVFRELPYANWFVKPYDQMQEVIACKKSGFLAGPNCEQRDTIWVSQAGKHAPVCPYHLKIQLSSDLKFRVNADCEKPGLRVQKNWFVLPPAMEWYYKNLDPTYQVLPPFRGDCSNNEQVKNMDLIYPKNGSSIYLPRNLDGNKQKVVLQAAHRRNSSKIFWNLNGEFIGETREIHQLAIQPEAGTYHLVLVDEFGERLEKWITIASQ